MKKLLIDLDGVCADFYGKLLEVYNTDFKDNLTRKDIKTWSLPPVFRKASRKQIRSYMSVAGFWSGLEPIKGAVDTLYRLQSVGHDIIIVSAAPEDSTIAGQEKFDWVHEHLPFIPHKNVILASRKELISGDILLDDGPHNLTAFPGISVAMDAPYNQQCVCDRRVSNWNEFYKLVESINAS